LISFDLNPPNVCCLLQVEFFCQQRESQSELKVAAEGTNYVPLYGAGSSMKQAIADKQSVWLGLTISIKASVRLFAGLMTKHYYQELACHVLLNPQHCYCHLYNLPTLNPKPPHHNCPPI